MEWINESFPAEEKKDVHQLQNFLENIVRMNPALYLLKNKKETISVENINLLLKQWSYSHQVIDLLQSKERFHRFLIWLICDLVFNLFLSCSTILLEQALYFHLVLASHKFIW